MGEDQTRALDRSMKHGARLAAAFDRIRSEKTVMLSLNLYQHGVGPIRAKRSIIIRHLSSVPLISRSSVPAQVRLPYSVLGYIPANAIEPQKNGISYLEL
jgi:hypothetical protein